jgi:phage shock protein PspC (stress-responsive transcriptional regulator)
MTAEQCTSRDETGAEQGDGFRSWRRDRRKWWEKAEAWDPERWKAMAAAWASMWEDAGGKARPGPAAGAATATRTCPCCAEEIKSAAIKCKHCGVWLAPPPEPFAYAYAPATGDLYAPPRLTRTTGNAMVCGVLGGFGRFFGIDPTWLRIAFALGTFFTAIVPGIIVYAMLALIIPGDVPFKGQGVE